MAMIITICIVENAEGVPDYPVFVFVIYTHCHLQQLHRILRIKITTLLHNKCV